MRVLRAGLLVSSILALLPGAVAGQAPLPEGVTEEMIARGEEIFLGEGACHICHGQDATGARGVGADLTDEEWFHSDGSYEAIVEQILRGVTSEEARNDFGAMMPPKGGSSITDEQVRAVAAYVWSLGLSDPR